MAELIPKTQDTIQAFAELQPTKPENLARAGETAFPGALDKWPVFDDGYNLKAFSKYSHDIFCSIIAIEYTLLALQSGGVLHIRVEYSAGYTTADPSGQNLAFEQILFPEVPDYVGRRIYGSLRVVFRGRELVRTSEWNEVVVPASDPVDVAGIEIVPAGLIENGDVFVIHYDIRAHLPGQGEGS